MGVTGGSDLGRRLLARRKELGLSLEKAAAGASLDTGYLAYLESATDPDPARETLERLAVILRTTPAHLRGGDQLRPPGRGGAAPGARLEVLSRQAALALITPGGVGRFVYLEARGPVAVPVNFAVRGSDIVFRTAATPSLAERAGQVRVSFEVDNIDEAFSEGWSVLVSGTARLVADPAELAAVEALGISPWAGGERDRFYLVHPLEVSGRRIRAGYR